MSIRIIPGNCLDVLPTLDAGSVQCCVTSPPYFGLRSYLPDGHSDKALEIGTESTPDEYVASLVDVFRDVWRVLRDDGVIFLNLGDSYNGGGVGGGPKGSTLDGAGNRERQGEDRKTLKVSDLKPKDLIGIPWRVAFALQADGWYLRSAIVWQKMNPMPESVRDRPTSAYEMVFLLAKSERYFYDSEAVREDAEERPLSSWDERRKIEPSRRGDPGVSRHITTTATLASKSGRNARNVWTIASQPFSASSLGLDTEHFATMPPELAERCIKAGSRPGDTVLDPFSGAGTTAMVADRLGRNAIGIELNPAYREMSIARVKDDAGLFAEVAP